MPESGESIVSMHGVGKRFDENWVLRDIDLTVDPGSIVGLIGPSGSGKTTAVRIATGTYRPDEGDARTFRAPPWRMSRGDRQRIGYLPQQPVLFDAMTLWENLNFHTSLYGMRLRRRARLMELLELVGLAGEEHKLVREASGGMQRRLALAATLAHGPELAVLDEPTAGIDPLLRAAFWEHFRELADSGTTLLISTQYVGEAVHCDLVGLLADGQLPQLGSPDDLHRAAYGGERLRIVTARPLDDRELAELSALPGIDAGLERRDPTTIDGVVADAGASLPVLVRWMHEREIEVLDSSELPIDYDDVFVRLVEAHRRATADRDADRPDDPGLEPARSRPSGERTPAGAGR